MLVDILINIKKYFYTHVLWKIIIIIWSVVIGRISLTLMMMFGMLILILFYKT